MRIAEKQLQVLLQIAIDTLRINVANEWFIYDVETRKKLVDEILNQQDPVVKDMVDDTLPSNNPRTQL